MDCVTLSEPPACFLIVYNISKKHNIGTLARSAAAFGVKEFCLVGSNKYNTFGSHGASDFVNFKHFSTLKECSTYLREQHRCEIMGIEIDPDAEPVHVEPFRGPTAFVAGNEGTGLNAAQCAICDRFVYVPQFGQGTASLNVTVACSVVLHRFATWAQYRERTREGAKFHVGARPQRRVRRGVVPLGADMERQTSPRAPSTTDGYVSDRSNSDSCLDVMFA